MWGFGEGEDGRGLLSCKTMTCVANSDNDTAYNKENIPLLISRDRLMNKTTKRKCKDSWLESCDRIANEDYRMLTNSASNIEKMSQKKNIGLENNYGLVRGDEKRTCSRLGKVISERFLTIGEILTEREQHCQTQM
ncbi:hypothetical protein J1614_004840 [Plenodomus biglobosus]|nr:hypothetical protein J1614_004840 [Plenodomus biglobosus]